MKKIIVIGDIHGDNIWEKIVEQDFDKVIFIGDYFDTFDPISANKQIFNFGEIVRLKMRLKEKVFLLIGNHDFHYLKGIADKYSGFQKMWQDDISEILHKAIDIGALDICHVDGEFLFTHAGVTNTWAEENNIDIKGIEFSINELFRKNKKPFAFVERGGSRVGDNVFQGPLWVRPDSLLKDKIGNYKQVVGHTRFNNLSITDSIYFIDTLQTSHEYLEIVGGVIRIVKLDK